MTLSVNVRHRLGAFAIDAAFETAGRLTALFGTSGSGKTSVINLIGGLIKPAAGRIAVDGRVLVDTVNRVFVPPHRRRIGMVFQDARLFPHMTVRQNLRYGRWFTPSAERYADFDKVVDLLGVAPLLDRRPSLLSGGEKQRVAIGRALIASPKLILMDEPLASLDEQRKREILPYIERLRDETKIPIVYVSHSVAEVARLSTDIVVMEAGRVAASGPTAEILRRLDVLPQEERSEGGTVLEMVVAAHDVEFDMTVLKTDIGEIRTSGRTARVGSRVRVRIRARDVMVATEQPRGLSALNVLAGTISGLHAGQSATVDVSIDCRGQTLLASVTRQSATQLGLAEGRQVFAVIKSISFDQTNTSLGLVAHSDIFARP